MRVEHSDGVKVGAAAPRRAAARVPPWVVPAVKAALVAADACVAAGSFRAAYAWREGGGLLVGLGLGPGFAWHPHFGPYAALLWFGVAVRLVSRAYYELYRRRG